MTTVDTPTFTPDDLLQLEEQGLYELVDGHLVEKAMSELSNETAGLIASALIVHAKPKGLGRVLPEQSFKCFPHEPAKIRRPDVAFLVAGRGGAARYPGHVLIAPDIVVEIVSPNELAYDLDDKLNDYRLAGVKLIWIVNPERRTVTIHRDDGSVARLFDHETLTGGAVLPEFRSVIADLLPAPEPEAPVESEGPPT